MPVYTKQLYYDWDARVAKTERRYKCNRFSLLFQKKKAPMFWFVACFLFLSLFWPVRADVCVVNFLYFLFIYLISTSACWTLSVRKSVSKSSNVLPWRVTHTTKKCTSFVLNNDFKRRRGNIQIVSCLIIDTHTEKKTTDRCEKQIYAQTISKRRKFGLFYSSLTRFSFSACRFISNVV